MTQLEILESNDSGYRTRTIMNASADITLAFAIYFNSAGEKLTKKSVLEQGKKYLAIDAWNLEVTEHRVNKIVSVLNSINAKTMNIAGNGAYTLKKHVPQDTADDFVYNLLKSVFEDNRLIVKPELIRSGGQSGFDESGIKAAIKLGVPALIVAPKGFKYRTAEGMDITDEVLFKARFGLSQETKNNVIKAINRG